MREIKFRGKRIDNGKWVYGLLVYKFACDGKKWNKYFAIQTEGGEVIQVDPKTVGQFTGLHDKNSKEIWEGDIIRYMDGKNMEVFYSISNYAGWSLRRKTKIGKRIYGMSNYEKYPNANYEIIGNIHENPELLG